MQKVNIRRKRNGFTIAELLITTAVLGFVMMLSVPIIGMKKAKNPNYTNVPHGTFECYYDNSGTLHAYQADSTENQSGSEGEVIQVNDGGTTRDACSFTMQSTSSILLQAVGAGGNAVDMVPAIVVQDDLDTAYTRKGLIVKSDNGRIRTDTNFKSDLDAAPDWVRENWDKLWLASSTPFVTYTVTSPVGKGGEYRAGTVLVSDNPDCEPCWNGGSNSTTSPLWNSGSTACPAKCKKSVSASGGSSGRQGEVVLKKQITKNEDVIYDISEAVTSLQFSKNNTTQNYFNFFASNEGGPAIKMGNTYLKGADGRDFDYSSSAERGYRMLTSPADAKLSFSGLKIQKVGFREVRNPGSTSAAGNNDLKVTPGTITSDPASYNYASKGSGAQIEYSPAGEPGKFVQKFYEKFPSGTAFLLIPARTSDEDSKLLVKSNDISGFYTLAVAESGKNATKRKDNFRIEKESDLPFPAGLYPALFSNVKSGFIVTASSRYMSRIADIISDESIQPGRGGYGVYPIIEKFKGEKLYAIGNINVMTSGSGGSYEIESAAAIDSCLDGSEPIAAASMVTKGSPTVKTRATAGKYCKSSITGNPGAVVVSW